MSGKITGLAAFIIAIVCFFHPPIHAGEILIQGSGNVNMNSGILYAMYGSTFTFEIRIDDTVPASSGGGGAIAVFNTSLSLFKVDNYQVMSGTGGQVSYGRTGSADSLRIFSMTYPDIDGVLLGDLPLSHFGDGPYTLNQIESLTLADFTETPQVQLYEDPNGYYAEGDITSISFSIVPTPTPTPQCIHHGDVNLNGVITAGDAQQIFLMVPGMDQCATTPTPTPTPTNTPIPTSTPTVPTPTPKPFPSTDPAGLSLLLLAMGAILGLSSFRKKRG